MTRSERVDITGGPIVRSLIIYTLPIILGQMVQSLFNAADIAVLGNMADNISVASVGASSPIVNLIVNAFIGLTGGTNVILARYLGASDAKNTKKTVETSMLAALLLGVILGAVGILTTDALLNATACPEECFEGAKIYLFYYFLGVPGIMLYNFGATILRVSGDTRRPLYYLIACGVLNVVMNIVLCLLLPQKVIAVAVATAGSQIFGAVLVVIRLCRWDSPCRLRLRGIRFDLPIFGRIMRYGLPCALNTSLYSISNLQIQSAINSFGPDAISGNTTIISIENFVAAINTGFSHATLAFVGQNVGAGNRKRVRQTILRTLLLSGGISEGVGLLAAFFSKQLLGLYIPGEDAAIAYGMIRSKYVLCFYGIAAIISVLVSSMQAFGYSTVPMLNSIGAILGLRILWMFFVYPRFETYDNLCFCYTVTWIVAMILHAVALLVIYRKYQKNRLHAL